MTFLVYLLRVLLILFLARLLFRFILGVVAGLRGGSPQKQVPRASQAGVPLVRDRVCNTFLPRDRALTATIDGRVEYFCSEACRRKALAA